RGEREARLRSRHPRLRHRLADPPRPRRAQDPSPHEQPRQVRGHRRLRTGDRRARPARDRPLADHSEVPRSEEEEAGTHPRTSLMSAHTGPILEGRGDSDYERYVRVPELLDLVKPVELLAHPEERLF